MEKFVYPAVLAYNEKNRYFTIHVPDLEIISSGRTVEEAYLEAEDFIASYLEFSKKMDALDNGVSTFEKVRKKNPKNTILLTSVSLPKNMELTDKEKAFKEEIARLAHEGEKSDE